MRVWIYTRESQNSLEEQKKQVRKFCEQKGWEIAGESGDRSNGFNYKRAGLNEAIMESSMGNADAVVIKDRSVLGQDPWINSCMIEELSRSRYIRWRMDYLTNSSTKGISGLLFRNHSVQPAFGTVF